MYGNPISPSFYSILLGLKYYWRIYSSRVDCNYIDGYIIKITIGVRHLLHSYIVFAIICLYYIIFLFIIIFLLFYPLYICIHISFILSSINLLYHLSVYSSIYIFDYPSIYSIIYLSHLIYIYLIVCLSIYILSKLLFAS